MTYRSRLLVLSVMMLLPFAPASAQGDEVDDSVNCISVSAIDRTEIIDRYRIAFHMRSSDIYINRLDRACRDLTRGRPFSYRTSTGQICSVDAITILHNFGAGLSRGASCGLGVFTPADEELLEILKGDVEEAEVIAVPVEVEE